LIGAVTVLDWAIVAFIIALALWGYRQGLIVGFLTLGGFALGAWLGGRIGPALLEQGSESPYAPLFAALGALFVGSLVAVALEGFALGVRSRLVRGEAMHVVDGAGGAILIGAVGLGIAWVFGAVALHAPGATELRGDVQRSVILRSLNDVLPPSGPILNALNRVDQLPEIAGPSTGVGPPNPKIASDPEVRAAGDSVVRVLGTACGLGIEGSGWVGRPGLVVTNAHVVAGEDDTSVTTQDGTSAGATPVVYDPANDLAVLRVDLGADPLPLAADPETGTNGAVLGYPENGPFAVSPARFGGTSEVISQDAYGRGPIRRLIASLRGKVRSGNSGGPMVDGAGRVLGTVFAATTGGKAGGFAVPNEIVRPALARAARGGAVDTGPCTG
jgi:S1-C subfamily serine protease